MRGRGGWMMGIVFLALLLAGCGNASSADHNTQTSPPNASQTPIATPSHSVRKHAVAWIQDGEVWASLDGAAPKQISHGIHGPIASCVEKFYGAPVFAPDLAHVAVASKVDCGGVSNAFGHAYVIDAATGTSTEVPLPNSDMVWTATRSVGWVDNTTLWLLGRSHAYEYPLAGTPVVLPGIAGAQDGVVRGSTLYYAVSSMNAGNQSYDVQIHRYDLAAKKVSAISSDVGTYATCLCAPSAAPALPGWDVSPDGSRIIWQAGASSNGTATGDTKSTGIKVASTDGTSIGTIPLPITVMVSPSWLRIAPDGRHFALVSGASTQNKQATLIEDCTDPTTAGSDACLTTYQVPVANYPGWTVDSTAIDAGEQTLDYLFPGKSVIAQYSASTPDGQPITTSGYSLWTTP